jgi:4-hydroxybenzoate polyprenyltransferase
VSWLTGVIRLVHPFPSILDGVVSAAVALLAGGTPGVALRLGLAMTALQFGIGATNDLVDAPRDAGHKPGKPIPAGIVGRRTGGALALAAFGSGLALSLASGLPTVALAAVVIGIGLIYDFRLKGTAWSWLPFAVGIPILPVFGWLGAAGTVPATFALLVPVAVAAGAALAIANALADVERDRAAGTRSIATVLGPARAWALQAGFIVAILAIAVVSTAVLGGSRGGVMLVAVASFLPIAGLALGQGGGAGLRERAWQLEAIGMAAVGVAWIWAILG